MRSTDDARAQAALEAANDAFHDAYDDARAAAEGDAPVLVAAAGVVVLFHAGARHTVRFGPPSFDALKAVAHVPLAVFAAVHPRADGPLDEITRGRLHSLRSQIDRALAGVVTDDEVARATRDVLDPSRAFVEGILQRDASRRDELLAFARDRGPSLLAATDLATRVLLDALHAAVEDALGRLSTDDRRELRVVVTGNHQARVRSLPMQYFAKRLGEPEGAEDRVTYAEGVFDVEEARALVGTRRLDRELAKAFFGDPHRLQRDVLGDSARARLAAVELPKI